MTSVEEVHAPLRHLNSFSDLETLAEVREATDSPTPLSELLHDPVALKSLLGHKKARRASEGAGSRDRSKDGTTRRKEKEKDKESDTTSILTLVLAEEERQAHHLKALLRNTGERLENEMRRADSAEKRAFTAETQAREVMTRLSRAESAQRQADQQLTRLKEELAGYRVQVDALQRELRRAENDAQRLERAKSDAEHNAAEERDSARRAQHALREWQAREEGRQEGRELELISRYNDGRDDGYEDGHAEGYESGHAEGFEEGHEEGYSKGRQEGYNAGRLAGFEEGRNVGWSEGFQEGLDRGHQEERENALRAFDKFVDSELQNRSVSSHSSERTREWVDSVRKSRTQSFAEELSRERSPYHGPIEMPQTSGQFMPPREREYIPPPRQRELPPTPHSFQGSFRLPAEPEQYRSQEREYEQPIGSATRARSPSVRSASQRATSPVLLFLHRRMNTGGNQSSRAMSPLPPLPGDQ